MNRKGKGGKNMRKIIDAHVHINPVYQLGSVNAESGIQFATHGRVIFPDGKCEQFLPDILADSSFTPETLIRVMDNAQVEKAVIIASSVRQIPDIVAALSSSPGRFIGAMRIKLNENCPDTIAFNRKMGLSAIKFEMSEGVGFMSRRMYPDFRFDSPIMLQVLETADRLGITVTIDPGHIGGKGYQAGELNKVIKLFSNTRFVICHLGFPDPKMEKESEKYRRWHEMISLAQMKNVWFDISALAVFYKDEAYPFFSAARLVREFMDNHGARKVIWGSDIPGSMCHATYKQLIGMFERSELFNEEEKNLMFYNNAMSAYF
jgi:predicted TIM-barrel fold metal-dependent hydrolase